MFRDGVDPASLFGSNLVTSPSKRVPPVPVPAPSRQMSRYTAQGQANDRQNGGFEASATGYNRQASYDEEYQDEYDYDEAAPPPNKNYMQSYAPSVRPDFESPDFNNAISQKISTSNTVLQKVGKKGSAVAKFLNGSRNGRGASRKKAPPRAYKARPQEDVPSPFPDEDPNEMGAQAYGSSGRVHREAATRNKGMTRVIPVSSRPSHARSHVGRAPTVNQHDDRQSYQTYYSYAAETAVTAQPSNSPRGFQDLEADRQMQKKEEKPYQSSRQ